MQKTTNVKNLRAYVKGQASLAHVELDKLMSEVPKACKEGCDACCYQMVSVHTWEEDRIVSFIQGSMHAQTKAIVRKQFVEWWRYLKSVLRPATRMEPITLLEMQNLQLHMIQRSVMCPFLVDRKCSIYPVRPAMCRAHVVPNDPERCESERGRIGVPQGGVHMLAVFGPESAILPVDKYPHSMKPLAFATTTALGYPAPSTPMQAIALGELL